MKTILSIILLICPFLLFASDWPGTEIPNEVANNKLDMSPLLFIIVSLFIGILTKQFLKKLPIPYTVLLLIIGLVLGVIDRFEWVNNLKFVTNAIFWAGHIKPEIILYVFLPTLIFEAAFDLDVHTFKKSFWNAFLMAVPGILVAIFISASLAMGIKYAGIGFGNWTWYISLMFGSVICATDPVAVVSILKELGGGKKLRTLIESESLLNDGTAIVIFMVFFTILTGTAIDSNPVVDFLIVTLGGVAIGATIGFFTLYIIKTVFNDPLFEITAIIGSAYLTFFIAESLHWSGIIGLVTIGLLMTGRGKTKISPEVGHFLHEFWVLAAFIFNTLIFIIVGVIIAHRTRFEIEDFIDLTIIYLGIHLIRGMVIFVLFPIMKKIGYGITRKDSIVLWWGGLRGVIGLAMALIVAGETSIDHEVRDQFLFITAGIVLLTSLINATTIKALVTGLGLTRIPVAKATLVSHTIERLKINSQERLQLMKNDRFMGGADWETVESYLPKLWTPAKKDLFEEEDNGLLKEIRINLLNKEKSSYWKQFSKGLLGVKAYNILEDINNELLDQNGEFPVTSSTYINKLWNSSNIFVEVQKWSNLRKSSFNDLFDQLNTNYDAVRAIINSQDDLVLLLDDLKSDKSNSDEDLKVLKLLKDEVNEKKIQGLTFLRNLKNSFPEVYKTIETRQASRDLLNYQKSEFSSMVKLGRVDKDDADKFLLEIEYKMNELLSNPPSFILPNAIDLLKQIPWIKSLDDNELSKISKIVEIKIFPLNYNFQDELKSHGLGILLRGNVEVSENKSSKVLEIGTVTSFSDSSENKEIISNSPVTMVWIPSNRLEEFNKITTDYKNYFS